MSTKKKLDRLLNVFTGSDHVLILINADPDSIASAMALTRILRRRVTQITISNINTLSRPDNLTMIRLFDVTLIHVSKIDPAHYTKVVITDSQPDHNEAFSRFEFSVVIDHHEPGGYNKAAFSDIRPEYGANSTILTEYLRAAGIKPSQKLATALFYGIKTDTNNFERAGIAADMRAFQYLFKHANTHLAHRIEQADLRMPYLEYFKQAIEKKDVVGDRFFVHIGQVENPDILVLIADFFLRVNTVTWSIVSGIHENRLIVIFRNDGLRKDAGKVAVRAFGKLGTAGGHKSMARAECPLAGIAEYADTNDRDLFGSWIRERVNRLLAPMKQSVSG